MLQQPDQLTEESVVQRNRINDLHSRILKKLGINVEENRHVNSLASIQPLIFKAETLNLAEIRRYLPRSDRVCSYSNNIFFRGVGGSVKSQGGFSRKHAHFALLWDELPRENVRNATVEGDSDSRVRFDGFEALGGILVGVAAVGRGTNGLPTPAGGCANLATVSIDIK